MRTSSPSIDSGKPKPPLKDAWDAENAARKVGGTVQPSPAVSLTQIKVDEGRPSLPVESALPGSLHGSEIS